ncbi:SURF1 family protein [Aquabacterium sp.]|uniref:SURF1 family protein n=1 Tax=Aquabacterium sp. TaxID=1872578 RepID=UPI00248700CE|nr:SURF1 family protein [Aquabacterium sp.]MDI1260642.1 SURF1 family protein [Aquabacterium sp.]
MGADNTQQRGPRSRALLTALAVIATLVFTGFAALGTWQVKRLFWKLDLIERVDQRVNAPAAPAPGPAQWPQLQTATDEYRPVQASGTFEHEHETLVQAVTAWGSGFWVLTPLRLADGTVLLINRGFVPPEKQTRVSRQATEPKAETTITGLLRMSEPGGAFLRKNDPSAQRWYSRDVRAISAAHGLRRVAPYFVDAKADPAQEWPVGGLTVIAFPNNHLVYAITWYALALMVLGAAWYVRRDAQRQRQTDQNAG